MVCGLVWWQEQIPKRHVLKNKLDLHAQNMIAILGSMVSISRCVVVVVVGGEVVHGHLMSTRIFNSMIRKMLI